MTGQPGWIMRFVTVTNGGSQPLGECQECGALTWDDAARARHREKCPRVIRKAGLVSWGLDPGYTPPWPGAGVRLVPGDDTLVREAWEVLARAGVTREQLGRQVRREWEAWARGQPDVAEHPAWTAPWDDLDDRDREAGRRIGEVLFRAGWEARGDLEGPG